MIVNDSIYDYICEELESAEEALELKPDNKKFQGMAIALRDVKERIEKEFEILVDHNFTNERGH